MEKDFDRRTREEKFFSMVDSLPKDGQLLVSGLSSNLLESDIAEKYKMETGLREGFADQCRKTGMADKQINEVFSYFGLPNLKPKNIKK